MVITGAKGPIGDFNRTSYGNVWETMLTVLNRGCPRGHDETLVTFPSIIFHDLSLPEQPDGFKLTMYSLFFLFGPRYSQERSAS
jgi:hypothetical protein